MRILAESVARARAAQVEVARVAIPFTGEVMRGEVVADPGRLLTAAEVASYLEIRPNTWRAYVARGQAPPADFADADRPPNRRAPMWRLSTVRDYVQAKRRRAFKLQKGK